LSLLILVAVVLAGVLLLHFGRHDARALADFSACYQRFSEAIAQLESGGPSYELGRRADAALAELDASVSARISSLTKHDAEIMAAFVEIGDLSRRELETLKAYQKAADSAALAQEFGDLQSRRAAAYNRFRALED
jgi:hypothetical protein